MDIDNLDSMASLPVDLQQRMELAKLLPSIRGYILPTMQTVTKRFLSHIEEFGWVDMKFDPIDGKERDVSLDDYRKDRVYGWIQGRGLESLTVHARWAAELPGYSLFDVNELLRCAEVLYKNLLSSCFSASGSGLGFIMDPTGNSVSSGTPGDLTTLTKLFVLRGLLAYASYRGYTKDLERIVQAARKAVDDSILGLCLNDQVRFGASGGEDLLPGRIGYEGQMIAIGACELLYSCTKQDEDLCRGIATIDSVLSRHRRLDKKNGLMIQDGIYADGKPYHTDGRLVSDPGHALEFVGLSLQFFRVASLFNTNPDHTANFGRMTSLLRKLASVYNRIGRAPHGGIVKLIDGETAEIINGDCPWWSSYEAVRTWSELYQVAENDKDRSNCIENLGSYVTCIQKLYLDPSSVGIPVQTVNYEGHVIPVIPATPDIDPGYHTGIPLIDAYELLGAQSTMLCGLGESRIHTVLGSRLQGHIARSRGAEGEMDPLHVRCCRISTAQEQLLLLSADVLEYSHAWAADFSASIASSWGIPKERIILLATHTHTAPCAMDLGLLQRDTAFLASLEKAMTNAISIASTQMIPMVGAVGSTLLSGIGINRRKVDPVTGKVGMRPNPEGERDDEVSTLFLFDSRGKLQGLFANMAVHPTTLGVSINQISADYPGRMVHELKGRLGQEIVAIPLQGACGDVRPMVVNASMSEFREGTENDINRIGSELASSVLSTLDSVLKKESWIEGGNLSFFSKEIELAFNYLPKYEDLVKFSAMTRHSLEEMEKQDGKVEGFAASHENPRLAAQTYLEWSENLLKDSFDSKRQYIGKSGTPALFSCWSFGTDLVFYTLPGEAFCHIGKALKKAAEPSSVMVCGYCGGSVGYIPTPNAFLEGGYEVESAFRFYGYPAPLSGESENNILDLFKSIRG